MPSASPGASAQDLVQGLLDFASQIILPDWRVLVDLFPILLVIVSLGVLRPDNWTQFVVASAIAVAAAMALNSIVPRLYPGGGEEPHPPGHGAR